MNFVELINDSANLTREIKNVTVIGYMILISI